MQSVLATRDFSESDYLVFATRSGIVKKTEFQAYNTPIKADGIIAINIRDDDELVGRAARRRGRRGADGLARRPGRALLRGATPARWAATRAASAAWTSPATTRCIAMDVARDDQYLLVVTENGFGKRTLVDEYRKTNRGAKGVKTIQQTEAKGAPRRRARRPRAPAARVHLRRTAWCSGSRCATSARSAATPRASGS